MRRTRLFSVVLSGLLLVPPFAGPVVAQVGAGNVAEVACDKIQPGKNRQYEEGAKKHIGWHRRQNDSWTWVAWQVITGEDTGTYCWGSFGHAWEDFDSPGVPPDAELADWEITGAPFVQSTEVSFWTYLSKVSKPIEGEPAMSEVIFVHTRYGTEEKFNYLVGEFHKAIEKTNMP